MHSLTQINWQAGMQKRFLKDFSHVFTFLNFFEVAA